MKYRSKSILQNLILLFALVAVLFPLSQSPANAGRGDWWMFGHDPQHTGRSPFKGPDTAAVKWKYTTGGYVYSSPAIGSDGTIYVASDDGKLYAINPDGSKQWGTAIGALGHSSPAIASDGTIYLASGDGKLYAINADGKKRWDIAIGASFGSSPAISSDGTIYVGSGDAKLYAINPDGSKKWEYLTKYGMRSSPAIGLDGTIYVGSDDNKLNAINPDGSTKWSYTVGSYGVSSPTVGSDGTVYVGSADTRLYAINPDGSKKWEFVTGGDISRSPSVGSDGTIYVGSNDYKLYAVNPDGSKKWEFPTKSYVWTSPAIDSKGTVYIGSADCSLYAINPDGSKKWEYETGMSVDSSPAIGTDGTVYFGSCDKNLYAIGPGEDLVLVVNSITPNNTLNTGSVNITDISGMRFENGASVKLTKSGQTSINATDITVVNSTKITCRFDVDGRVKGAWDVVVENPNSKTGVLKKGFTINPVVLSDEWCMFGHDAKHTRRSPYVGPSIPALKWTYTTWTEVRSSPSIGRDGTIYAPSSDGRIFALDPDGTKKWKAVIGCSSSSPAIASDGTVYIGSSNNRLYALNADCTNKWEFMTNGAVSSSPVFGNDGTIYVGCEDTNLYAINSDGSQKWHYTTDGYIYSSPALGSDGTIYVGADSKLYAINADGSEKWEYSTVGGVASSPAIGDDGTIYVGSNDHKLYAVNPDGSKYWEFTTGDIISSSPAIGVDGTIYVGSRDSKLYAINPDGSKKWEFTTGDIIYSSPSIDSSGTIYVGSYNNRLYAINPDGSIKWVFVTGGPVISTPTISSDGTIYVGSDDNKLYAIGQGDTPTPVVTLTSVLPASGHNVGTVGTYIYGTGFMYSATIKLTKSGQNDIVMHDITWYDSTKICGYFDLVGKQIGDWNLVVTNLDTTSATLIDGFNIYTPAPTVASINPVKALNTGSVSITKLAGTGFLHDATVKLTKSGQSDIVASDVSVLSSSKITCTFDLTGCELGAWNVVVTNLDNNSGTLSGGFTIEAPAPTVTAISPNNSLVMEPVTITNLSGTGFLSGATVKLAKSGMRDITATDISVVNSTKITCKFAFDVHDIGSWNVVVTNPDMKSGTLIDGFGINSSVRVTGITPDNALNSGTANITNISGTGFAAGAVVRLKKSGKDTIVAYYTTVVSSTKITCTFDLTGLATGVWDVEVTNPDGQFATLANAFTIYNPFPTVTGITPNTGVNSGSLNITELTGTGFLTGATVKLTKSGQNDIIAFDVRVVSSAKITCTFDLNGRELGTWNVVVTNPDARLGTLPAGLFIESPAPTVTNIMPNAVFATNEVISSHIYGTGFISDATIKLTKLGQNDIVAIGVVVVNSSEISCVFDLNNAKTGRWNVVVTNPDGKSGMLADGFDIVYPTPTLTSITPDNGLNSGTTDITYLSGKGFVPGAVVRLRKSGEDSIVAYYTTVVGDSKITCTFDLTGIATGNWDVEVTNPDDQYGTLYNAFKVYNPYPTVTGITPNTGMNPGSVSITDLAGTGFLTGATVKLIRPRQNDIVATDVTVVSASKISCAFDLNGKEPGPWSVVVTNPDTRSGKLENGFNVNWTSTISEWHMFGHDIHHTGRSPHAGPDSPTKRWGVDTGGGIQSSPAIGSDGTVYVGSNDNNIYAINPDGSMKWEIITAGEVVSSPAVGLNGTVYVGSSDKKLYAIYPDGSERWTFATGGELFSSPVISSDGTIYIGSNDKKLYAINPDGSKEWAFVTNGAISSSPAIGSDGAVYVGSSDYNVYAINSYGSKRWAFRTEGVIVSSPAIASDGTVYVGSADGKVYAINPDGSKKWDYNIGNPINSSPAIGIDGTVYIGSEGHKLYAISSDGTKKWEYETDSGIGSSPAIDSDGTIYIGSKDNKIYAINPDGLLKWKYDTGGAVISSPAIGSNGMIYVASMDGKLYAIGGPSVTVDMDASQQNPTSISPIRFRVTFSEPVADFTIDDVSLSGTAGATTIALSNSNGDQKTFTVSLSGMTSSGSVIVSIPSGVAHNADGAGNTASTNYDNAVSYIKPDTSAPAVTINQASAQVDPTSVTPINFVVQFSEPVRDFGESDITLGGTTGAASTYISNPTNDKMYYAVSVVGMTKSGTLTVSIPAEAAHDAAGNGNTASTSTDNSVVYDIDGPILALTFPTSSTTFTRNGTSLTLRGTATDPSGVAALSYSVNSASPTSSSSIYYWEFANLTLVDGVNTIDITATDNAGNRGYLSLSVNVVDASPDQSWNGLAMVSLPIIPDLIDPKVVVGFAGNSWTSWDPVKSKYAQYASTQNESWFVPRESTIGRGFWARFEAEHAIPLGLVPAQNKPMKVHLYPGWNLIGTPYINPVIWDLNTIQVETGSLSMSLLNASTLVNSWCWGWDSVQGKYYLVYDTDIITEAHGALEPWLGYWIKAITECDLVLPTP